MPFTGTKAVQWLKHPVVWVLGGLALLLGTILYAPVILPYHVSGAMLCYIYFIACIVWSIGIGCGKEWKPFWGVAFCEVGLLYALETLCTGAWWGYHAWGAAWVWEPRLTGMFLMTLFFLSWRLACAILGENLVANRQLTASLIILGLPAMFFTHVAVRLFGGIHPTGIPQVSDQISVGWVTGVIAGEILTGLGVIRLRAKKMQSGRRMETQSP